MSSRGAEAGVDRLLGGRLALRQPATGHRAGTDAVLLAASVEPEPGDTIVDAGSGVGTIGLMLALRQPGAIVRLVEREASLAALARVNVDLNGCGDRVTVHEGDLGDRTAMAALAGSASLVVSNPPFYPAGTVRPSPDPLRARAHGFDAAVASPAGWLACLLGLVRPHGRIVLIHLPAALPSLVEAAKGRLGGLCIRPVLPRPDADAIRVLVGGIVGSRAALRILAPLVLHENDGFTALAQRIHRGETILPLLPQRKRRPVGPPPSQGL